MEGKQTKKQNVLIKGTKDGLTFFLNDQCTFEALISELKDKLSERLYHTPDSKGEVKVKLVVGKRYLVDSQKESIKRVLMETINGVVDIVESDVILKEDAKLFYESKSIQRIEKIIRSGQVIEGDSDLMLIGDVNPGGTIRAKGNIYIMGKLLGSAHAGCEGNEEAMIFASQFLPTEIKISNHRWDMPEEDEKSPMWMSCAHINERSRIEVEEIAILMRKSPSIFM